MVASDSRRTCGKKSRIAMPETAFSKKRNLFTRIFDLNLSKKTEKCNN
jgi:hypothetical protein